MRFAHAAAPYLDPSILTACRRGRKLECFRSFRSINTYEQTKPWMWIGHKDTWCRRGFSQLNNTRVSLHPQRVIKTEFLIGSNLRIPSSSLRLISSVPCDDGNSKPNDTTTSTGVNTLSGDRIGEEEVRKSSTVMITRKAELRKRAREHRNALQKDKLTKIMTNAARLVIVKLSTKDWERTFDDSIAPQHTLASISNLRKLLEKSVEKHQKQLEEQQQDKALIILGLEEVFANMLITTDPDNTLQVQILERLLCTDQSNLVPGKFFRSSSKTNTKVLSKKEDKHIQSICLAREQVVINRNLYWNAVDAKKPLQINSKLHKIKTPDKLKLEAQHLYNFLQESLPVSYFRSILSLFKAYSAEQSNECKDKGTKAQINAFIESDGPIIDTLSSKIPTSKPRELRADLLKHTKTHFHLVAESVAKFFYLKINGAQSDCEENEAMKKNIVVEDTRFKRSKVQWEREKLKFCESMEKLQQKILDSFSSRNPMVIKAKDFEKDDSNPFAIVTEEQTKSLTSDPSVENARYTHLEHIKFEASVLISDTSNASLDNMIFLDNLPIDITDSEIREIYSRCGPVHNVEIFNLRPDLDPGPLQTSERAEMLSFRLRYTTRIRRRWLRPVTPVYAMVSFGDNTDAYNRATKDSLRIFGVIIRRHPVRTIRVADVKSLHLTDIIRGTRCQDLEFRLTEMLTPDVIVEKSSGHNNYAFVKSCEISFPSFEVAYKTYIKFKELDDIKKIIDGGIVSKSIHWFRTSYDAELWWTRKLGFD